MCDKWSKSYHNERYNCKNIVINEGSGDYTVSGRVKSRTSNPTVIFWAANPPTYNTSFAGSGLPYPNPTVAYENCVNKGAVVAYNKEFKFKVHFPNSYYVGAGTVLVQPHVNFKVCEPGSTDKIFRINLGESIPYRTLTYPSHRSSCLFYQDINGNEVLSQEMRIKKKCYPTENKTPSNFWG